MNIAYKLMTGKEVKNEEFKYLLWLTLLELQDCTTQDIVGGVDEEECFNINDMLDALNSDLTQSTIIDD